VRENHCCAGWVRIQHDQADESQWATAHAPRFKAAKSPDPSTSLVNTGDRGRTHFRNLYPSRRYIPPRLCFSTFAVQLERKG
jgi:hypothetical protein